MREREEISRGLAVGISIRVIATTLGRSPSTICREIAKNGGSGRYRASDADQAARKRARRPKTCLLACNVRLLTLVAGKLAKNWSPEQISGWFRRAYTKNADMHVSHETIYKSLFIQIQIRGIFKKELRKHLRTGRKFRRSRTHRSGCRQSNLDGVSISERPAFVEDRAVPGHGEGDLICGTGNSYIATVVERQTRFTLLVKVAGKRRNPLLVLCLSKRTCCQLRSNRALLGYAASTILSGPAKLIVALYLGSWNRNDESSRLFGGNQNGRIFL